MPMRWPIPAALLGIAAVVGVAWIGTDASDGTPQVSEDSAASRTASAQPVATSRPSAAPDDARLRAEPSRAIIGPSDGTPPTFDLTTTPLWIAAASGAVPELNQVSIEQDIALAAEVLGPGGRVLFGAGPGTPTVQVLAPAAAPDPVLQALGELFSPRGGRDLRYRPTTLNNAEPATAASLLDALDHAVASGRDPLVVYLAGHGNLGETPRDNTISLWAQSELTATDLAATFDRTSRPVRLVMTTCFSGGFAEIVFRGADQAQGPSPHERCGLFAAPWDLEATGCDPNPDRAAQDGYGLHFLNALRGRDRQGTPLPIGALDFDGDRHISLLEAHTRARIASTTADVPTSTTERWLRHAAPQRGPQLEVDLPEEAAVIEALAARLDLVGRESEAYLELQRLGDDLEALSRHLEQAQLTEDDAYRHATAELLARWPVLDDPWHPAQAELLRTERRSIVEHLETSERYAAYQTARREVDRLGQRLWDLRERSAPYERLTRALDNRRLAARLHARGGADWATFERILACERGRIP